MKTLEQTPDTLKRICDVLKYETLEPAKLEAEAILESAKDQADQILFEARKQAKKIMDDGKEALEQQKKVFNFSLEQSAQQTLESLKQSIEQKMFNQNIEKLITEEISSPQVIAKLIEAVISGIQKEGVSKDFTLIIPKTCSSEEIARHLTSDVMQQLSKNPISIGNFNGGIQVKLLDKKLRFVITEKEICDYLKQYVRKDFRALIFASTEDN